MKSYKTQFARITDAFIGVTAIITAVTLVASGIAVSKINTEYMATGIKTAKIVAERENEEIFFSLGGKKVFLSEKYKRKFQNNRLSFACAVKRSVLYI